MQNHTRLCANVRQCQTCHQTHPDLVRQEICTRKRGFDILVRCEIEIDVSSRGV